MKDRIRRLFDVNGDNSIRLVLFNIITFTVLILGMSGFIVMIVEDYGGDQLPGLVLTYITLVVCVVIANVFKRLKLATCIIISVITFVLFPWMFFSGGGAFGGMPIYYALGMIFVFLLLDGPAFVVLLVVQVVVYAGCFVLAYLHPEWVIPLGDTVDVYIDVFQSMIVVSCVIGLINKFEMRSYENLIKEQELKNQALKESEKRAEQANIAKSDFLSNMSHEIRTPINAIIGINEVIRRESSEKEIVEYADIVSNSANALLSIVNDILDFSKIESGKMDIVNEKYDLFSLLNDCFNMVSDRASDKNLEFIVDCDEKLPAYLLGDIKRLRQVILNILSNAVKYTDEGSVTLKVRGNSSKDNIDLVISVIDTGIGMKKEDMERLFGKFERFDPEHNQAVEGTGLGLTIVKNLVNLMHGEVSVESEYGKGSTFTVIIPQKIESEQKIGKTKFGVVSPKKQVENYKPILVDENSKVLVVDDVQMNLLVFKKLIKDTKIQVDTCISGEKCLEMIREEKYDIIFMDHMMPGMNGIETFKSIRGDESHLNIDTPVVMLTANAISGMDEEYRKMGFSDYISKPIDVTKLEQVLKSFLKKNKDEERNVHIEEGNSEVNTAELETTEGGSDEKIEIADEDTNENANQKESVIKEEDEKMNCEVDINVGIENCGGEPEFYEEIVQSFIDEGKKEELIQNYADKDWELYTINVHSLKGTLRLIGAMDAGEVAEKLQFAGQDKDIATIDSLHNQLINMIDISLAKIKGELA